MSSFDAAPSNDRHRELLLDVSEWRRFRHRITARVRVRLGDEWVADHTLHTDDDQERAGFWSNLLSQLLLRLPDNTFPNAVALDTRLLQLAADAEVEAATVGDALNGLEERFLVDDEGQIAVETFLNNEAVGDRIVLANFAARIVTDVVHDDGAQKQRFFEIEAVVPGVRSTFSVPAKEFSGLDWIAERLGPEAIVVAGASRRDKLREGIQRLSTDVRRHTIHAHLGWRVVRGEHVFLHSEGAIGRDGVIPDVDVQPPAALARYRLPAPPGEAGFPLGRLLRRLDTLPEPVALPVFGGIVAAALDEVVGGTPSVLVLGATGMMKSSLIAALLHFSGGPWTAKNPPSTWESTANALEKLAFAAAATPFWVDDLRPAATRHERDAAQAATQRLLREVVTRSGRQRLGSDINSRPTYYPRGPVITSAELLPRGASTLARLLVVPMVELDTAVLAELQDEAPAYWSQAGAAWVQYIAAHYEQLQDTLTARTAAERADARVRQPGLHLGLYDSLAGLLASWHTFLSFAIDCGVLTGAAAKAWFERMRSALDAAIATTHRALDVERAESEYLEIVHNLLEAGTYVVDNLPGFDGDGGASAGWYDQATDLVYLITAIVDPAVNTWHRAMHGGLSFPIDSARRALKARGLLERCDDARLTFLTRPPGSRKPARTLVLKPGTLFGEEAA
jgi:hypothetical protein